MSKQYNMQIRASALVQRYSASKSVKLRAYVLAVLTYSHIFQACYAQIIYVFTCLLAWCLRVCLVFYVFYMFTCLLGVLRVCLLGVYGFAWCSRLSLVVHNSKVKFQNFLCGDMCIFLCGDVCIFCWIEHILVWRYMYILLNWTYSSFATVFLLVPILEATFWNQFKGNSEIN